MARRRPIDHPRPIPDGMVAGAPVRGPIHGAIAGGYMHAAGHGRRLVPYTLCRTVLDTAADTAEFRFRVRPSGYNVDRLWTVHLRQYNSSGPTSRSGTSDVTIKAPAATGTALTATITGDEYPVGQSIQYVEELSSIPSDADTEISLEVTLDRIQADGQESTARFEVVAIECVEIPRVIFGSSERAYDLSTFEAQDPIQEDGDGETPERKFNIEGFYDPGIGNRTPLIVLCRNFDDETDWLELTSADNGSILHAAIPIGARNLESGGEMRLAARVYAKGTTGSASATLTVSGTLSTDSESATISGDTAQWYDGTDFSDDLAVDAESFTDADGHPNGSAHETVDISITVSVGTIRIACILLYENPT